MGVTIPARIQPGSIDHVPFPLVLGRLWLYERKPAIKVFLFSSWIIFRCVHRRGNRNASFSAGVAWSGSVAWLSYMRLGIFLTPWHLSLIHSARPDGGALFHYHLPPFLSSRLFTHEDRRMYARLRLPVRVGRSTLWQDQSPGQTNPPPRKIVLCPPDPYRAKELPGDP
ncbi:hypothetical protein RIF29_47017 [Crotalaria pallida]|uniref:Uncharacterized protein n=1 Tax=Crotalaria pallida TaxID=3830 RepID=A0AAN9DS82_CROPI